VSKSLTILALVLGAAGCRDAYQVAIDEQVANYAEIASVLRAVNDPASMDVAERKIAARAAHFREASRRAQALPMPDDEGTVARIREQAAKMQAAVREVAKEFERIRGLPGGPEFIERIGELSDPRGPKR
jgi:hypothetical protein